MSHSWAGDPSTQDYSSTTDAKSAEEIERKAFDAWYMDHFSKPRQWAGTREELFNAWQARAALATQPPAVQGEPLTELLIEAEFGSDSNESYPDFLAGVRFAERYYGIHSRGEGEPRK